MASGAARPPAVGRVDEGTAAPNAGQNRRAPDVLGSWPVKLHGASSKSSAMSLLDRCQAKVWCRRISPVSARPVEGPLTEPIPGVQPARLELVFTPRRRPCSNRTGCCNSTGVLEGARHSVDSACLRPQPCRLQLRVAAAFFFAHVAEDQSQECAKDRLRLPRFDE